MCVSFFRSVRKLSEIFAKQKFSYQGNGGFYVRPYSTRLAPSLFSNESTTEFMSYFPQIVKDATEDNELTDIKQVTTRLAECLDYTIPTGKKIRGLTTVISYKFLEKSTNLTPENIKLANILGWCVEMFQASSLITDDIIDNSVMRRNKICWHEKEGLIAIFDAETVITSYYNLLKKYFSGHPSYVQMFEFSQKLWHHTMLGQIMDTLKCHPKDISMDKYKLINKYKNGCFSFYYPVTLAMYLSQTYNDNLHNKLQPILRSMAEFYQINNDAIDCFADETLAGKKSTDIQEGKCTWVSARAVEKCSPSQRKFFEQHYGQPGTEQVEQIKNLYLELNVLDDYLEYEKEFLQSIQEKIARLESPYKDLMMVLTDNFQEQMLMSGTNMINVSTPKLREHLII